MFDIVYLFFITTKLLLLSSIGKKNFSIFFILYFLDNFLFISTVNSLSISPFMATKMPVGETKCIVYLTSFSIFATARDVTKSNFPLYSSPLE